MQLGILGSILQNLAVQLPVFLAWVVGLVLAITRWQRYPRAARLLTASLALFLILGVLGGVAQPLLIRWLSRSGALRIGWVLAIYGLVRSLIAAAGWGLLFAAVFAGRASPGDA
jgi:hypothetical protein